MVEVVDMGALEVVDGARVRNGRPCLFNLSLSCPELDDSNGNGPTHLAPGQPLSGVELAN